MRGFTAIAFAFLLAGCLSGCNDLLEGSAGYEPLTVLLITADDPDLLDVKQELKQLLDAEMKRSEDPLQQEFAAKFLERPADSE